MNWYKKSQLSKYSNIARTASMTLSIPDAYDKNYEDFKDILSICSAMNRYLWNDIINNDQYIKNHYTEHQLDSHAFDPDGNSYDRTNGVINFYGAGSIPPDRLQDVIEQLVKFLESNNVKVGRVWKDKSKMYDVDTVRFPILHTRNAHKDPAQINPDINMGNANAHFIFQNVLKYDQDLWTDGEFDARELKKRVEYYLNEEHYEGTHPEPISYISKWTGGEGDLKDFLSNPEALSGKNVGTNYDDKMVKDQLNRIKDICDWAIRNGMYKLVLG